MRQFAVIGLGRFGMSVARTLHALGYDVLAVDSSEDLVQEATQYVTHAVQADARDEETLRSLGIRNFDLVVVAIGEDIEANVLVTVILKQLGVKYVIAKAHSPLHGQVLEKIGADKVVYPERDMALRLAHNLTTSNILDYIELSPQYSIVELTAKERYHHKTLAELNLRVKEGIWVLAVKRDGTLHAGPGGEFRILPGDELILICPTNKLASL
ncbi:TrkA family potassium uptake protein [Thermanaerosceptrum fracticalcis]|uniref:TrkA family potassium uptake protein n=1 Tax=Thermanaerosceptrum fracticalcis TaxID=1712410 RepID=A0A7G6E2A1_THEFR|nr:TrkA family potassium uptake protein [Thermanaerosceptrum fracticalcis]QNB46205.1 TrkA family potassium uptake protein [Thermanaerosceptrum fracticalcis]